MDAIIFFFYTPTNLAQKLVWTDVLSSIILSCGEHFRQSVSFIHLGWSRAKCHEILSTASIHSVVALCYNFLVIYHYLLVRAGSASIEFCPDVFPNHLAWPFLSGLRPARKTLHSSCISGMITFDGVGSCPCGASSDSASWTEYPPIALLLGHEKHVSTLNPSKVRTRSFFMCRWSHSW